MISIDGMLYFTADLGSSGEENQLGSGLALLKSDGTAEGTRLLKEFQSVNDLVEVNGELYFIADGGTGNRLWKSDGTARGTELVKDLYPGADPNFPQDLFEIDGVLFYSAIDGTGDDGKYPYVNGYEVWRREGDEIGSRFFRNLVPDKIITDISEDEGEEIPVLNADGTPILVETGEFKEVPVIVDGQPVMVSQVPPEFEEVPVRDENGVPQTDDSGNPIIEYIEILEEKTEFIPETEPLTKLVKTATVTTNIFENDSFPKEFTEINGNFFFAAQSNSFYSLDSTQSEQLIGGLELWFSDGTEAGTRPININQQIYTFYEPEDGEYKPADIIDPPSFGFKPNSSSSFPRELTKFNNDLILVANDGISGFELWTITDQGINPRQISDISVGSTSSSPEELTVVGDRLYFTANDKNGRKLWSITSTLESPTLISGAGDDPKHLTNIDGKLYFSAKSELGRELWVATDNSARLIADINPGSGSSSPKEFKKVNHWVNQTIEPHLYFSAKDGERGVELWSVKLTAENSKPERQADIFSGPTSSEPRQITNADERLFFTADDGRTGRELWTLGASINKPNIQDNDGITSFTVEENQKNVHQFTSESIVTWSLNGGVDEKLFKIKTDGNLLFRDAPSFDDPRDIDGDNTYEVFVRATDDKNGTPTDLKINVVVTSGGNSATEEDEDTAEAYSTTIVKDIYKGPKSSNPTDLIQYKHSLLFAAKTSKKGIEIWKSKGSKDSTSLLKDINPGEDSSAPSGFTLFNKKIYFSANNGESGVELWETDGSSKGTKQVAEIRPGSGSSSPSYLATLDNKLLFSANDGNNGSELWSLSKGANKPKLIKNINPNFGSAPKELTNLNQKIYFSAQGEVYGRELWETDGTKEGTKLVLDINPGGFNSNPLDLTIYNKKLYFTAETYAGGRQVWGSDGTQSGTQKISPLVSQSIFSNVEKLTSTQQQLFFSANGSAEETKTISAPSVDEDGNAITIEEEVTESKEVGRELWSMKDHPDSIKVVKDINPGPASSNPTELTSISDILYFGANDGRYGEELWMSDGTSEGTIRLTDINRGFKDSSPRDIVEGPDGIYFSAIQDEVGRELWRLNDDDQSTTRIVTAGKGKKKLRALNDSNDEFRFELANQFGKAKADRITGFSSNDGDQLALSTNAFPGLSEINLVTVSSKRQLKAQKRQPSNFSYYEDKGKLYFDSNGPQKGYGDEGGLFAILKGGPDLTESSFLIL